MINEFHQMIAKEKMLKKLNRISKNLSESEIDDISKLDFGDNLDETDFKKVISKVKIKFKSQNI